MIELIKWKVHPTLGEHQTQGDNNTIPTRHDTIKEFN